MVNQKMKLRNSATMTAVFMMILLGIAMFFGGYTYMSQSLEDTDIEIDDKYAEIYITLNETSELLNTETEAMKVSGSNMSQSTSGWAQMWNGVSGLVSTMLLTFRFIPIVRGVYEAVFPTLSFLPGWVEPLISTGILIFVVFLVIKVMKGEPNM